MKNVSTREMLEIESKANIWLENHFTETIKVSWSSPAIMFSHIGDRNIRSMLFGTMVALIGISLILIFAFKSLRMGLISLLPNLAPACIAFGLWSMINGRIGLSLSVVAAMTLGVVVDDTIYFLNKYSHARRILKLDVYESVRHVFSTVGKAMLITSIVLVGGFLVLSQSHFELNSSMGLLSAMTVGIALLADFLLLPTLLMKVKEWLG